MYRIGVSSAVVVCSLAISCRTCRTEPRKKSSVRSIFRSPVVPRRRCSSTVPWRCCIRSSSPETVKAFTALAQQEPSCAMAYWGIAISQRPNPLVAPFPAQLVLRQLVASK